ncbi:hypothetical protein K438DRAFT_1888808 [Mycena galopus ATCC 62051]|nr:hypothetical protein K438DRAFT_1888808 [Mycena galopus ATCC 62051]
MYVLSAIFFCSLSLSFCQPTAIFSTPCPLPPLSAFLCTFLDAIHSHRCHLDTTPTPTPQKG